MNPDNLERYIADKYEMVKSLKIYPREIEIKPAENFITTITGPRRSGKTYILYSIMENSRALYLNFDDVELFNETPEGIIECVNSYLEIFGNYPGFVLLDEIQNVSGWERAVRELHDSKRFKIVVTGSSSKLLSREVATSLRGRTITYNLFPPSFSEFLKFKEYEIPEHLSTRRISELKSLLAEYIKGTLPDVILYPELAPMFYQDYANLVIFRDIIERYSLRNIWLVKFLFKSLISSTAKEFSVHKIFNALKSQGVIVAKTTLYEYVEHFYDAMVFLPLKKYSKSVRKRELSLPKVYPVDPGIAYHFGVRDKGRLLENVIYLELLRRYGWENVFYWNDGGEVDFVVIHDNKEVAIQVSYELTEENKKRELSPLVKFSDKTGCENLYLITWSEEGSLTLNGKKIQIVPAWRWLLGR